MPDFALPDLGEGLTDGEIVRWHVQVGDEVSVDQIVVEVETAKAAVEVPIPFGGVVSALHAREGEAVAVGAPLVTVDPVRAEAFDEPGVAVATPPDPADREGSGSSGNVLVGYGTAATASRRAHPPRVRRARADEPGTAEPTRPDADGRPGDAIRVISPLVRAMARAGALDIATVRGTGPSGMICRRDVERALTEGVDGRVPAASMPPVDDAELRIPLRGARKAVADKLSRSRREIPEATVWVDVDATDLLGARAQLNRRADTRQVSILALLARFAVLGLRRYPELNGRVEGDEIVLSTTVNLGFAAQTDRGLVVPVVHDAGRLATRDLAAAMGAHTVAARAGSLRPAELGGGTFTVNNYGVFGVDGSAAIINHPEVAILGIGRIVDKPWVVDGALAVRKVSQLTLAFDHRVCDGATAGGFLRFVADCVESPVIALGEN